MKTCLIITNCFDWEIRAHLNASAGFSQAYKCETISTYLQQPGEDYVAKLASADLVISQNVKSIPQYTPQFIASHLRKDVPYIRLGFWRFDGFWPIPSPNGRANAWFCYPPDEFGTELTFADYISYPVDRSLTEEKFEQECQKLQDIDAESDVKIHDLFLNSYRDRRVFSDHWHPMPIFFKAAADQILSGLGFDDAPAEPLPPTRTNAYRYRIVLDAVHDALGVKPYDGRDSLVFFGRTVSVEDYYYFGQHLVRNNLVKGLGGLNDLRQKLNEFLGHSAKV